MLVGCEVPPFMWNNDEKMSKLTQTRHTHTYVGKIKIPFKNEPHLFRLKNICVQYNIADAAVRMCSATDDGTCLKEDSTRHCVYPVPTAATHNKNNEVKIPKCK